MIASIDAVQPCPWYRLSSWRPTKILKKKYQVSEGNPQTKTRQKRIEKEDGRALFLCIINGNLFRFAYVYMHRDTFR